jgi:hypothetical protein
MLGEWQEMKWSGRQRPYIKGKPLRNNGMHVAEIRTAAGENTVPAVICG